MKKALLLMTLGAFSTMPMTAQVEEDYTQYIANAGFDEDLTWNTDGSKKGEKVRETELSDRSIAYVTEDGSLYATVNSKTPKTRSDGRTFEATNGFVGQIKGWEWVTPRTNDGCEWVYFGTLPYELEDEAIPIADDGTTYMIVPERSEEFEGGTGALYLRAGWGGSFSYKQEVKLPCAEYRLEYWTINVNPNTTATATDLSKITCRRDVFREEGGTALTASEWTKHEFYFTPVDKFTIEFGFQAGSGGSGTTPWVFIDGIKLYKIGEADPIDLLRGDMYFYNDQLSELKNDSLIGVEGEYFIGLYEETESLKNKYLYEGEDQAKLEEAIANLKDLYQTINEAAKTALRVEALYFKALTILDATDYPGKNDFKAYTENVFNLLYSTGTSAQIAEAETGLQDAINTYYFSQPATMDQPANYSFLVPSPWFCHENRQPADNDMANIADAQLTADDLFVDGNWVNGSTAGATAGGYLKISRTCYQLWATNFTGYLDAHTELTNLPNGIYSVSMDMITNANALSDQHVYATSTLGQSEGYMTDAGVCWDWISDGNGYQGEYPFGGEDPWETVTTEQNVIVIDGKLTIGARSTHNGRCEDEEDISDALRRGCFWFTNVTLRYHGPATQEQIDAAVASRVQTALELADAMHFAADKKAVNDSIAAYNETKDFAVLNNGIAFAQTSEAKYQEIMEEGKTLPTVAANLEDQYLAEEAYGPCVDLVSYANTATLAWLNSSEASYKDVDARLNLMKGYTTTYTEAAKNAAEVAESFRSTSKDAVEAAINAHKERLMPGENQLMLESTINEMVADLNKLLAIAEAQDIYDRNPNGTDYTAWIINPDFADIAGWDVIKGTGNGPLNQSQYYTGDEEHKYFDSFNSTPGELNIYGEQVIKGLPNGTYTARVAARTSNVGAFLFASTGEAKADTIWKEIPMETYTYFDPVSEKDTTVTATDKFGSIWEDAFQKYQEGTASTDENAIATANGQQGRGWRWVTIENIQVTDHQMTIGQTTDGARTGKPFEGTWFSVVDWSLTLTAKGDNSDWNGPLTGVKDLNTTQSTAADGIYSIDGRRATQPTRGLYIVVRNGKANKVLVK